jgi:hypothetical protein
MWILGEGPLKLARRAETSVVTCKGGEQGDYKPFVPLAGPGRRIAHSVLA